MTDQPHPNSEIFRASFPVRPMGKPRMTQRDKFAKRPETQRYWAWKAEIKLRASQVPRLRQALEDGRIYGVSWIAHISPPKSWSKGKKLAHVGTHHQAKPDRDNIDKALLDALLKKDEGVAMGSMLKVWTEEGNDHLEVIFYANPTKP